jgi:hypothetical protein
MSRLAARYAARIAGKRQILPGRDGAKPVARAAIRGRKSSFFLRTRTFAPESMLVVRELLFLVS